MMSNESNNLSGIGKDLKALFSAMEEKMLDVSVEEKIHFAFTMLEVSKAYGKEPTSQILLVIKELETIKIMALGIQNFEAIELINHACAIMTESEISDAPPKEMFN
jgi:hypothetical protein